jgi:hypothetical protein
MPEEPPIEHQESFAMSGEPPFDTKANKDSLLNNYGIDILYKVTSTIKSMILEP